MGSVLNTVYNNYLTTYTPKALTRFDTHKKSELRSLYNSIVRLNRDAPWYLPTTAKDTQQYAVDLKENARELHNTIAQLGGFSENVVFSKKSAYSSDDSVLSASYIGAQDTENELPALELEVRSLAGSQENLGVFLPDTKVSLPPDSYSFNLALNDMNYEFQFTVGESETNRDVQERLVRLINSSGIGVKASLAESEGRSAIRLTSETAGLPLGKTRQFTVSDENTSKSFGTVDYFGLNYVDRAPSNAVFTVNGQTRSASSNHFTVGQAFEIRLHGVTEPGQSVSVGLKTDVESLTDNVTNLIGGYNSFLRAAASYLDTQSRSRKLVNELKGIATAYDSPLKSMGITQTDDGLLQINSDLLRETAMQSQDLTETFGSLKGLSGMLLHKSDQVSLNPMDYVQKTIVAYKNPGHNYVSPYTPGAYSGMMFNSYC